MPNVIDLDKLENKILQSDGSFQCFCPACGEEGKNLKKKDHLRVWPNGAFSCVVNPSDRQHNAHILQLIGTESDGTQFVYTPPEQKIILEKSWPLDLVKGLIKNHSYWNGRGISSETCDYFNIGLAFKGQMAGRSVIPLYSETRDKIIGFTGRALHKDNKIRWKHLGEKQFWLFPALMPYIRKSNSIILLEGPADALALYEYGIKNTLCLFGTTISSKQLAFLIKSSPDKILIGLNNEPGNKNIGLIAAQKLKVTLDKYFSEDKVQIALPPTPYKDFCEILEAKDRIALDSYRKTWLT